MHRAVFVPTAVAAVQVSLQPATLHSAMHAVAGQLLTIGHEWTCMASSAARPKSGLIHSAQLTQPPPLLLSVMLHSDCARVAIVSIVAIVSLRSRGHE